MEGTWSTSQEFWSVLQECWLDDPEDRPTVRRLMRSAISTFTLDKEDSGSVFDKVMHRLEAYAGHLKEEVDRQTESLKMEQKKCEEILYEILPK